MDRLAEQKDPPSRDDGMAEVVNRNIAALLERRQTEEQAKPAEERSADAITAFTGSMAFVYLHLAIFAAWIVINLRWIPHLKPFDPTFVLLATATSVEAICSFHLRADQPEQDASGRRPARPV